MQNQVGAGCDHRSACGELGGVNTVQLIGVGRDVVDVVRLVQLPLPRSKVRGLPGVERGVVGPMDLVPWFKCIDKSADLNTND